MIDCLVVTFWPSYSWIVKGEDAFGIIFLSIQECTQINTQSFRLLEHVLINCWESCVVRNVWSNKGKNVNEIHIFIILNVLLKQNTLFPPSYSSLFILPCCQSITMNLLIVVPTYLDKNSNLPPNLPMVLLATYHPLNNTTNLCHFTNMSRH